jgi:hypothetical protein
MHSDLNSWNSSTKTEGTKELISNDFEAVSVSIDISGSAVLKVLWSNTNSSLTSFVDYGDTFTILDDDYNFCVSKKAKYFYVKLENPANITKLKVNTYFLKNLLKSSSEASATGAVICYGKDPNNNDIPLKLDASGNLKTTGSGGSGGGDASSANQLLQITEAETTNSTLDVIKAENMAQTIVQEAINEKIDVRVLKCDTDNVIIDSSDPIQTLLLAKVESTLNNAYLTVDSGQNLKVSVSNQNDISTLATEETQSEIKTQLDKLTFTDNKLKVVDLPEITEPIYLDFDNNSAQVIGDSPAGCWYNPNDEVEGWGYINQIVGGAQVYYYTNTALVANASEPNITLGSVSSGFCVASLNLITNNENSWIMAIYTKPTGSGDAQFWYKSRKSYQVTSSFPLSKGVDYLFYWGSNPVSVHPELQHVEMALASTQGTADPSEIVQFMSVSIPSTVAQNQFVGRVKRAGYVRSEISREVYFLNSNSIRADLRLNQLKFDTIVEDVGKGSLYVKVDNATFTEDEISSENQLNVRDDKLSRELSSLNSTIGQGVYINMETDPSVSGGVKLSGDATTKSLFVNVTNEPIVSVSNFPTSQLISGTVSVDNQPTDYATQTTLSELSTLVTNQSAYNRFQTEASVTDGKLDTIMSNMSLTNFNVNNLTKCDTDAVTISNGNVTVSGEVGLLAGTQVNLVNSVVGLIENTVVGLAGGAQVQLTNSEVSLVSGSQVGISNFPYSQLINGTVSIDNLPTKQSVFVENTTEGFDINVNVTNASLAITTASALDTNITNSSLDVHNYASSNGSDWHHLASDANGRIITLSRTHDGSGNDIASLVTEADGRALNNIMYAYDAADDAIKRVKMGEGNYGGLYVENAPATNLVVGKGLPVYNSLYTGALNAADNFGNLTVADYSTCDIMIKIPANACSSSGYLYVSFSEDGTAGSWYDTSIGVNINTSTSDKTYWLNVPSFCMSHISVTGRSPWGSGTLATTNSIIRIVTKK